MNLSELFIRRPVMTVLLNLGIVLGGVIGYNSIPVAALPSYDTPVINVGANLPGANPETMATSVALPLEKQFQTIPGLKTISSSSTLGNTSLTLEFEEGRTIDAAAVDVQAALLRAQRSLPQDMTSPPAYRKVNPADAPVLLIAMTSPSLAPSDLQDWSPGESCRRRFSGWAVTLTSAAGVPSGHRTRPEMDIPWSSSNVRPRRSAPSSTWPSSCTSGR